jgi:NAD(P)-dependent dehydrogenase (short-subunit alcohol dehydrogenase family)
LWPALSSASTVFKTGACTATKLSRLKGSSAAIYRTSMLSGDAAVASMVGALDPIRFWEVASETWRMVVDTNVTGSFLMVRAIGEVF